jgi:hypothetical protein
MECLDAHRMKAALDGCPAKPFREWASLNTDKRNPRLPTRKCLDQWHRLALGFPFPQHGAVSFHDANRGGLQRNVQFKGPLRGSFAGPNQSQLKGSEGLASDYPSSRARGRSEKPKNRKPKSKGRSRSAYRLRPTRPAKHGGGGKDGRSATPKRHGDVCSAGRVRTQALSALMQRNRLAAPHHKSVSGENRRERHTHQCVGGPVSFSSGDFAIHSTACVSAAVAAFRS